MQSEIIELTAKLIKDLSGNTVDAGDFVVKITATAIEITRRGDKFAMVTPTEIQYRTDFASPRTVRNVLWSIT